MKRWVCFAFFLALVPAASATGQKKIPAGRKAVASRYGFKRKSAARKGNARAVAKVIPPARQTAPSNERYREIQEALATKGYLATPPNGEWDQNSQDAMRRFQADQKLDSSGKLTSRSIIALGLGSPSASPVAAPPPPK